MFLLRKTRTWEEGLTKKQANANGGGRVYTDQGSTEGGGEATTQWAIAEGGTEAMRIKRSTAREGEATIQ